MTHPGNHTDIRTAIDAAKKGDIGFIKKWITDGNNPDQYDKAGWTPLLWASARGQHETVAFLINNLIHPANASMPQRESGALPIHMAGQSGNVRTVEILLDHTPDQIDAVFDMNGHTVLLQAVFYGHIDLASMLVKRGASTSITTARGLGPMELANQFQNTKMAEVIKPYDTSAEAKKAYYESYLRKIAPKIEAGEEGAQALADDLVAAVSQGLAEAAGDPASVERTLEKVRLLVEKRGADVNRLGGPLSQPPLIVTVTGNNGFPPNRAMAELRNRLAQYLIEHGADPAVHEKHPMGAQTIIRAAVFNHLEILRMCGKVLPPQKLADAINEIPLVNGLTAMHDTVLRATMAAPDRFEGYLDQTRFFVANGGRTDIEDFAGVTQRDIADRAANPDTRKRLLDIIDHKE